jgi:phosphatidylinositol alpha-mannosyltransferase
MRIAMFHTTLPQPGRKLGGVEVAVHRLAQELAKNPDDRVTVWSVTPAPSDATYEHVQLAPNHPWLSNNLPRLTALPLYLNRVDFSEQDVLHLHGDDWFFLRRQLPTVRTFYGSALREAQMATSLRNRITQYALFPMERVAKFRADLSLALGRDTSQIHGLPDIVDIGVDLELFRPGKKAERPTILFVGTWAGRKRGAMLHDLFVRQIRVAIPDAELVMVSDHCEPAEGVRFVSFPDDKELARLFREAWVFAYPSRYEGFGMAYLESMASGTAVVATPNGGAAHLLDEGRVGVIVNDASFGDQVIALLRDPVRRGELENVGRRRAEEFSWAAIARHHRGFYELAVSQRRA